MPEVMGAGWVQAEGGSFEITGSRAMELAGAASGPAQGICTPAGLFKLKTINLVKPIIIGVLVKNRVIH